MAVEVLYYFNAKGADVWNNAANMVDNILTNYASTDSDGAIQLVNGNNCPGTDLGTISNVEIRVYAYGDGLEHIDLVPVFGGTTDGDTHHTTSGSGPPGTWGVYQDITNDTNHPSPWTWAAIQTLDCKVSYHKIAKANMMYCAKVQIRVTYSIPGAAIMKQLQKANLGADLYDGVLII